MPSWNPLHSSETPRDFYSWLLRISTRAIGKRLLTEPNLSPQQRELIEEELGWRIQLMRKLPQCDQHAIFHYNHKGFRGFTSEYREILQRDLSGEPSHARRPGSEFLDLNRSLLEKESGEAERTTRVSREVEQEHEAEKRLAEKHERMRRDHENRQRERGAREREEAHAREMSAREERARKARELEHERYAQEMDKRAREARRNKASDHQLLRDWRYGQSDAERRDSVAENEFGRHGSLEARPQRRALRNKYDDETDDYDTDNRDHSPKEPPRGQNSGRSNVEHGNHKRRKSVAPRQSKSSNRVPDRSEPKPGSTQTSTKMLNDGKHSQQTKTRPKQASHPVPGLEAAAKPRAPTELATNPARDDRDADNSYPGWTGI